MEISKNLIEFRKEASTDETVIAGYINEYAGVVQTALSKHGLTKEGEVTGNATAYRAPGSTENIIKFYLDGIYVLYMVMYSSKLYVCVPNESLSSTDFDASYAADSLNFVYYETDETVMFHTFAGSDYAVNTSAVRMGIVTIKDFTDNAVAKRRFILITNNLTFNVRMNATSVTSCNMYSHGVSNQLTQVIKIPFAVIGNYYISEFYNMFIPVALKESDPNNAINDMRIMMLYGSKNTYFVH